MLDVFGRLVR